MKIAVYNCREDELEFFDKFSKQYNVETVRISADPDIETTSLAKGCECISITSDRMITKELLAAYKTYGVKYISSRTVGMDHIDAEYAGKIGIKVGNINYSTDGVADQAIMLMLMVIRKVKHIMIRYLGQDYTLAKSRGYDLGDMTVGIIGTGNIGTTVAKHLSGFGCKVLACGMKKRDEIMNIVEYVDIDTLLTKSDIITLHIPATKENYHFIDQKAIGKMKPGVFVINTARGALIDSTALIEALECGKVGGAGLDVIEGDREIYYLDHKHEVIGHREMAILNAMPNVILMPHTAFFTEHAVSDMVENSIKNCCEFFSKCQE
ncbi:MAG: D-isomer specific 2-hydroxyacid dehydrogenase family protein [Clostridiaceae bacterium]